MNKKNQVTSKLNNPTTWLAASLFTFSVLGATAYQQAVQADDSTSSVSDATAPVSATALQSSAVVLGSTAADSTSTDSSSTSTASSASSAAVAASSVTDSSVAAASASSADATTDLTSQLGLTGEVTASLTDGVLTITNGDQVTAAEHEAIVAYIESNSAITSVLGLRPEARDLDADGNYIPYTDNGEVKLYKSGVGQTLHPAAEYTSEGYPVVTGYPSIPDGYYLGADGKQYVIPAISAGNSGIVFATHYDTTSKLLYADSMLADSLTVAGATIWINNSITLNSHTANEVTFSSDTAVVNGQTVPIYYLSPAQVLTLLTTLQPDSSGYYRIHVILPGKTTETSAPGAIRIGQMTIQIPVNVTLTSPSETYTSGTKASSYLGSVAATTDADGNATLNATVTTTGKSGAVTLTVPLTAADFTLGAGVTDSDGGGSYSYTLTQDGIDKINAAITTFKTTSAAYAAMVNATTGATLISYNYALEVPTGTITINEIEKKQIAETIAYGAPSTQTSVTVPVGTVYRTVTASETGTPVYSAWTTNEDGVTAGNATLTVPKLTADQLDAGTPSGYALADTPVTTAATGADAVATAAAALTDNSDLIINVSDIPVDDTTVTTPITVTRTVNYKQVTYTPTTPGAYADELTHTVTYTITYENPTTATDKTVTTTKTFYRTAILNSDGSRNYSAWTTNDDGISTSTANQAWSIDALTDLYAPAGWTPKVSTVKTAANADGTAGTAGATDTSNSALGVNGDTFSVVRDVTYTANTQTLTVQYEDDNDNEKVVKIDTSVTGKTVGSGTYTPNVKDIKNDAGTADVYELVAGQSFSYSLTSTGAQLVVHVKHKVTTTNLTTDSTDSATQKSYTIVITGEKPSSDGKTQTPINQSQTLTYQRTSSTDLVTGITTYGAWTAAATNPNFVPFTPQNVTGWVFTITDDFGSTANSQTSVSQADFQDNLNQFAGDETSSTAEENRTVNFTITYSANVHLVDPPTNPTNSEYSNTHKQFTVDVVTTLPSGQSTTVSYQLNYVRQYEADVTSGVATGNYGPWTTTDTFVTVIPAVIEGYTASITNTGTNATTADGLTITQADIQSQLDAFTNAADTTDAQTIEYAVNYSSSTSKVMNSQSPTLEKISQLGLPSIVPIVNLDVTPPAPRTSEFPESSTSTIVAKAQSTDSESNSSVVEPTHEPSQKKESDSSKNKPHKQSSAKSKSSYSHPVIHVKENLLPNVIVTDRNLSLHHSLDIGGEPVPDTSFGKYLISLSGIINFGKK